MFKHVNFSEILIPTSVQAYSVVKTYIPFEKKALSMKQKNIMQDKYSIKKNNRTVQDVLVNTA